MEKKGGFSLIEAIIALAILGMGAMYVNQSMQLSMKSAKSIDYKSDFQNFGTILRYNLFKPLNCAGALELSDHPIIFDKSSLPTGGTPLTLPISEINISNKKYSAGVAEGQLKVVSMSLILPKPLASGDVVGTLAVELTPRIAGQVVGGMGFTQQIPVYLTLEDSGTTQKSVKSCYSQDSGSSGDAEAMCKDLGGTWLTGDYMPKDRCNLSPELMLAVNELPNDIPANGEIGATNGARIESCYYQPAGDSTVYTYPCSASWGKFGASERCRFDKVNKSWGLWYYTGNTPTDLGFLCSKGVKVTNQAPSTVYLPAQHPLSEAFGMTTLSFKEEQDRLQSVRRCRYSPNSDLWYDCTNVTKINGALDGQEGSCIYARGINVTAQAYDVDTFNKTCGTNTDCKIKNLKSYTGWIHVETARQSYVATVGMKNRPVIQEAQGTICYTAEIDLNRQPVSDLSAATTAAPSIDLRNTPSRVGRCVHTTNSAESFPVLGLQVQTPPATRSTEFVCDNLKINTNGPKQFVKTLKEGSCWYFKDGDKPPGLAMVGYHEGSNSTADLGAVQYTNNSLGNGWVYLMSPLQACFIGGVTDACYKMESDYSVSNKGDPGQLYGVPCEDGVRIGPVPVTSP